MFSNEQRFVWDIDSLVRIKENPTQPNLLEASAILRRIFMDDGEALLNKVSRGLGMKARFRVFVGSHSVDAFKAMTANNPVSGGPIMEYVNPDPSISQNGKTEELSADDFLRAPIHSADDKIITVKEVIRYCSDVGGGVHQGTPRKKNNAETIHKYSGIQFYGHPMPLMCMSNVLNIALEGLMPLYSRLRA